MLAKCDIYGHFNDTMQNLRSAWRVRKASVCKNASEWENWKLLDLTSILTNLYGSSWKILNRQKRSCILGEIWSDAGNALFL